MVVDWLILWGVSQAVKPILEDLVKDAAKDWVKDFFKSCLSDVVRLPEKKAAVKAAGKALNQFVELVHSELAFGEARLSDAEVKQYDESLKHLIKHKAVQQTLGTAFDKDCRRIDVAQLNTTWQELKLHPLPDQFSWEDVGREYLKQVRKLRREDEELRKILDSEILEEIAENTRPAGVPVGFDLGKYQESLREEYGNLRLESLDTSGYAYNELKLWRMFIPQKVRESQEFLPQLYELPKEYQQRLRESGELEELSPQKLERLQRIYAQQQAQSVLEVVKNQDYKYLVILGDPGSGKSTLLQYLALEWAELPQKDLDLHPIPLLIELRTYLRNWEAGQCKNFLEFVHGSSGRTCHLNQHELHEWLKTGQAIVMFDGLDEVFDRGKREDIIADIHRFTNEYPDVQVIVTSRVIGYKPQKLRDAEFRHFMLQDLEKEQIDDFIQRWHDLTYPNEREKLRKRERLQKAIEESKAIRELAGNPLLLTMMAILNRHQELPRNRAELYNQASRVLLHQWDIERALEDSQLDPMAIDYTDKQAMLRKVAYFMQGNEQGLAGNLINAEDLESVLTDYLKTIVGEQARRIARVLIHQLRTRNFMLCFVGSEYYAFVHRTFLEYFCAWEFVLQFEKQKKLSIEELKTEVYGQHWQDETWHEVLRLIAGMIDPQFVGEIIEYLMEQDGEAEDFQNLFLASSCVTEVVNRYSLEAIANRLLKHLKTLLNYGSYESGQKEFVRIILTRLKAVQAIATGWKDEPGTLAFLQQIALSEDQDQDIVRVTAVRAIASGWKEQPDTLAFLKDRALSDEHGDVRRVAVGAIASGWKHEPDTLAFLKDHALSDEHWHVRVTAVRAIASGWKHEPDTLAFLKDHALSDEHGYVRGEAVGAIASGWKEQPDTLAWLKDRALSDENEYVREVAVGAIASSWQDDPERFDFLHDRALNDPFQREYELQYNPRQTALKAIVEQYPNHPQTLPLLRDRAENDPDEQLRQFAKEKLAAFD